MRDADELKSEKHHVIRGQTEHRDLQIENTSIQIVLSFVLILKKKKVQCFGQILISTLTSCYNLEHILK